MENEKNKRKREGKREMEGLSVKAYNGITTKNTKERAGLNHRQNRRSTITNCLYSFFFFLSLFSPHTHIMSAQIFSYEEVSKHNTRNDLYMIIDKKVYDITKFL